MSDQPQRFILQAIDPDLGCPAFEAMFVVERLEELRHLLGDAADDDPELEMHYRLESAEVAAIGRRFDVPFDPGEREAWLCRWTQSRDEIPYLVHTGYELPLMLEGRKQFARMGGEHYPPHRHWNEDRFDHYVAQGLLHREIELAPFSEPYQDQKWPYGRRVEDCLLHVEGPGMAHRRLEADLEGIQGRLERHA